MVKTATSQNGDTKTATSNQNSDKSKISVKASSVTQTIWSQ